MNASNDSAIGSKGAYLKAHAQWIGYYFNDVYFTVRKDKNYDYLKGFINLDNPDIVKQEDKGNKTEFYDITFTVAASPPLPDGLNKIDIYVDFLVRNTDEKKTSTLTLTKPNNDSMIIDSDYLYNSLPTNQDYIPLTNVDSLSVINDLYITSNESKLALIQNNLKNDFCFYNRLLYQGLSELFITDTVGGVFAGIATDPGQWKIHVSAKYNPENGIFQYISITGEIPGGLSITKPFWEDGGSILPPQVAGVTAEISIYWGTNMDDTNWPVQLKNINATGPKLLGAYTMNQDNHMSQIDQSINQKQPVSLPYENPYHYDYLSLVPSDINSLLLYDVNIKTTGILKFDIDPGYHSYFLQQPRTLGMEFQTGRSYINEKKNYNNQFRIAPGEDIGGRRKDDDSLKNSSLNIPSMYLSGYGVEDNKTVTWKKLRDCVDIQKCELNINTLTQNFKKTSVYPNAQIFAHNFMQDYLNNDKAPNDSHTKGLYKDYWYEDENKDYTFDNFISDKKQQSQGWQDCIPTGSPWENGIKATTSSKEVALPWYQVLQEQSYARGSDNTYKFNMAMRQNGESDWLPNMKENGDSSFSDFYVGLNYMFSSGIMIENSDNVYALNNIPTMV
ncbi:MAG: hypothetical protein LBL60_02005 [Mycoplasmataceae bacterium]|nr:hypothetical protein [Mycoplasmataceae bacterium]